MRDVQFLWVISYPELTYKLLIYYLYRMKKNFLYAFIALCMMSCNNNDVIDSPTQNDVEQAKELNNYAEAVENVIDYKTARFLAYLELENGASQFINLPDAYELAAIPRVVYDYNSCPKYYEFDILANNTIVATVTTHAQKEDNTVIAYMFEKPINTSKTGFDAFMGQYPNVYHGKKGLLNSTPTNLQKSVSYITTNTTEEDVWAPYEDLLSKMNKEDYKLTLADIEMMKNSPEIYNNDTAEVNAFWRSIKSLSKELQVYEDAEICRALVCTPTNSLIKSDGIKPNPGDLYQGNPVTEYHIIPQFNNERLKNTRWSGKCGPSIVSWTYRGLYANYPHNSNQYIPIHGDKSTGTFHNYTSRAEYGNYETAIQADHGVYKNVDQRTGPSGELYHLGLSNAVKDLTGGTYKLVTTAYSHKNIKNNEPVFVMVVMDGNPHYFLAFGYGYTKKGTKKTEYIYIHDNGAMTENNTAKPYYSYWHKETSNYGLRYKVAKR